jgi:hypothetical protein
MSNAEHLTEDEISKLADALYEKGWDDSRDAGYDPRERKEWQDVVEAIRARQKNVSNS